MKVKLRVDKDFLYTMHIHYVLNILGSKSELVIQLYYLQSKSIFYQKLACSYIILRCSTNATIQNMIFPECSKSMDQKKQVGADWQFVVVRNVA